MPRLLPLQVIAGLLGGVIQAVAILTKHDFGRVAHSPLGAASPCLSVLVVLVSGVLVPALAPRWFQRHGTPLFAASRLLYFSLPSVRNPRAYAHILQVRSQPPSPYPTPPHPTPRAHTCTHSRHHPIPYPPNSQYSHGPLMWSAGRPAGWLLA